MKFSTYLELANAAYTLILPICFRTTICDSGAYLPITDALTLPTSDTCSNISTRRWQVYRRRILYDQYAIPQPLSPPTHQYTYWSSQWFFVQINPRFTFFFSHVTGWHSTSRYPIHFYLHSEQICRRDQIGENESKSPRGLVEALCLLEQLAMWQGEKKVSAVHISNVMGQLYHLHWKSTISNLRKPYEEKKQLYGYLSYGKWLICMETRILPHQVQLFSRIIGG